VPAPEGTEEPDPPLVRVHADFHEEFPDASGSATECFLNLGYVATSMLSALNRLLGSAGVPSYRAFNALTVLAGADHPLPPSVVADHMVVTRPRVSGILDSLERRDLITRAPHGSDGRMRLVALTDRGREVVGQVLPEVHRFEARLFEVLAPGQQAGLLEMLALLADRLASMDPDRDGPSTGRAGGP
jgi:DNA-binding MarR family transcriptional regulator